MNQKERRKQIIDKRLENSHRPCHFIAKNLEFTRSIMDLVLKSYPFSQKQCRTGFFALKEESARN